MASAANFSCFDSNLSTTSITYSVWSLDPIVQTDTASRYAIAITLCLLLLVGLPSNLAVIAVILKKRLLKKQPTIILLFNLAITDLLMCVLVLPINITTLFAGRFNFGSSDATLCRACQTGFVLITLSMVILNTVAALAVDRFMYLKAALHYSRYVTHTRAALAVLFTWVLGVMVALPPLFGFSEMRFSTAVGICTIAFSGSTYLTKNSYYLVLMAGFVMLPIITLVITNAWGVAIIQHNLRRKSHNLKMEKDTHRKSFHEKMRRQQTAMQTKLVKIYSAIFLTNLITYLPMLARIITGVAAEQEEFSQAVRVTGSLAYIALMSQTVVHPLVQASLVGDVRRGLRTALHNPLQKLSRRQASVTATQGGGAAKQETESTSPSVRSQRASETSMSSESSLLKKPHSSTSSFENAQETVTPAVDATNPLTANCNGLVSSLSGSEQPSVVVRRERTSSSEGRERGDCYNVLLCGCKCWENIVLEGEDN